MDLNVKGLFNVLGEALMSGFLEEPGSVVHVASMFAERGYYEGAVFAASKHAAVGMVKSDAREAGERRIRVNVVMPRVTSIKHFLRSNSLDSGAVETPMFRQVLDSGADNPTRRLFHVRENHKRS